MGGWSQNQRGHNSHSPVCNFLLAFLSPDVSFPITESELGCAAKALKVCRVFLPLHPIFPLYSQLDPLLSVFCVVWVDPGSNMQICSQLLMKFEPEILEVLGISHGLGSPKI